MTAGSSVENWALVIGIDKYMSDKMTLHGGVRDALLIREWLLDGAGGGVPAEHLVLVLAPRDDDKQNLEFVEATCPLVHVAHKAVRALLRDGYHPVIIGQRHHAELQSGGSMACTVLARQDRIAMRSVAPVSRALAESAGCRSPGKQDRACRCS